MHDIEDLDYDRWCEYILYRGLYRTSFLRMSRGSITDTELQVGQFVVPRYSHQVTGEWGGEDEKRDASENRAAKEQRYLRVNKEILPVEHVSVTFRLHMGGISDYSPCITVVPDGILWRRKARREERSLLSCVRHTIVLQHPGRCNFVKLQ